MEEGVRLMIEKDNARESQAAIVFVVVIARSNLHAISSLSSAVTA